MNYEIEEGNHLATSTSAFGLVLFGFGRKEQGPGSFGASSYAMPGGMKTEIIYVP